MHQNSPFSDKKIFNKFWGGGTRPRIAGEIRLLSWTTLSTDPNPANNVALRYVTTPLAVTLLKYETKPQNEH